MLLPTLLLSVAACGGDDGDGGTPAIDARAAAMVSKVDCAGVTPAVTVTAPGFAFQPSNPTISVGGVVKFQMPAEHDARSSDGLWHAMFGMETCVKFDSAGAYRFFCTPHGFTGTVTVQ